jgi:hypothetical protein
VLHPRFSRVARNVLNVSGSGSDVLLTSSVSTTAAILIDDETGIRSNPTEPGCSSFDLIGGPWVVGICPPPYFVPGELAPTSLYNIPSHKWIPITVNPAITAYDCLPPETCGAGGGAIPEASGADWIEYWAFGCDKPGCPTTVLFQNIATGAVESLPGWVDGSTTIPNLNSPTLSETLCAPLTVPRGPPPSTSPPPPPLPILMDGKFAIAQTAHGASVIERCGSSKRTPIGADPVENAHVVIWTVHQRQLDGISLPSGRAFAIQLPRSIATPAYAEAVGPRHIYIRDANGTAWRTAVPRKPSPALSRRFDRPATGG